MATNAELEEKAELLERIDQAKDVLDDLPTKAELQEMVKLLHEITDKLAFFNLPDNDDLSEIVDNLERIDTAKSVLDDLPSNEELDETVDNLERIKALKSETTDA
jgi:hypothetical protein